MRVNQKVFDALRVAAIAHDGQYDKGGNPYILHPITVAMSVDGDDAKILALLHDVVEDTDVTNDDIRQEFGDHIADALDHLTHRKDEDYDCYIDRVMECPIAITVKLADIKNNMDLSRIPNPTIKDFNRVKKYERAKKRLLSAS